MDLLHWVSQPEPFAIIPVFSAPGIDGDDSQAPASETIRLVLLGGLWNNVHESFRGNLVWRSGHYALVV